MDARYGCILLAVSVVLDLLDKYVYRMYQLKNYCVRSSVYKIQAKHALKRPYSHLWAVAHC